MCVYVCVCPFSSIPGYLRGESLPCVTLSAGDLKVNQGDSAS